jgi:hypothetical protein
MRSQPGKDSTRQCVTATRSVPAPWATIGCSGSSTPRPRRALAMLADYVAARTRVREVREVRIPGAPATPNHRNR